MKPILNLLYEEDPFAGFDPHQYSPDLQGWGSQHRIFEKLIVSLRPTTIIEVGTWKGASAIHMANLCKEHSVECEIVCIDTWLGTARSWTSRSKPEDDRYRSLGLRHGYPTLYYTFLRNVVDAEVQRYVTPLPQTSENAAEIFRLLGVTASLIYIDGAHEYSAVYGDLKAYWPLVAPGGILFGDDFGHKGVHKAVTKFAEKHGLEFDVDGRKYAFTKHR